MALHFSYLFCHYYSEEHFLLLFGTDKIQFSIEDVPCGKIIGAELLLTFF